MRPARIHANKMRHWILLICLLTILFSPAAAQPTTYVGAIGGIATLSADAGSRGTAQALSLSSYAPANGGALNVFAGVHHGYRTDGLVPSDNNECVGVPSCVSTTLPATTVPALGRATATFQCPPAQPNLWNWDSAMHEYISVKMTAVDQSTVTVEGTNALDRPVAYFVEEEQVTSDPTVLTLKSEHRPIYTSHVGIDLRLARKLDFRYSFSEMIGHNEISKHLAPPAPRGLANFQNLFGFVVRF